MYSSPETLVEDVLFLACTRPATVLGVPMEAMGINLALSSVAFLAADSLAYLLVAPAVHLVFQAVCRNDPNAFRILFLGLLTKLRSRNGRLWGGSSATPLELTRFGRLRGMRDV